MAEAVDQSIDLPARLAVGAFVVVVAFVVGQVSDGVDGPHGEAGHLVPVPYTNLTLPTTNPVEL